MNHTKKILTMAIAILLGASTAAHAFDPKSNLSLNLNKYDEDGWTPTHHLAKLGEHRRLRDLITKFGGKPNLRTRDDNQHTPLHLAAKYGHHKAVEVLLAHNRVDANALDTEGNTAMHHAAASGNGRVVELLVGNLARINNRNLRGETPLHTAAASGSRTSIEALIKGGANVNVKDNNGDTPMHHAARHDNPRVIYWLSLNGEGKETKDRYGRTPLYLAVVLGKTNAARELIKIGARTNILTDHDPLGRNALHNAALGDNAKAIKTLIALGYDKEARGRDDWRAIHYAAFHNRPNAVRALIDAGADVYAETKKHSAKAIEIAEANHGYHSKAANILRHKQYEDYITVCSKFSPVFLCDMGYPGWRMVYGNTRPS